VGIPLADALITLAAVDPCYCCTERSLKVFDTKGRRLEESLLKLSREKTEKIRAKFNPNGMSSLEKIF